MAKEIERKFLLAEGTSIPIPEEFCKYDIKQAYILAERNKQVRIRISTITGTNITKAIIGIKFTGGLVRDEFEVEMDVNEGQELYEKCDLSLEKRRLSFKQNDVHYDVDTFPNGMTFVEAEFESEKAMEKWVKPSWIGEEITKNSEYSNIVLAMQNLKF
jgi:CYTH domain-containing protein